MSVPDFQSLMLPTLQIVSDGKEYTFAEVANSLVSHFKLTEDDLKEMLPSGRQTRFTNRYSWTRIYLKEAGLIETTARRSFHITPEGLKVLSQNPSRIDIKFLSQFPEFIQFRQRGKSNEQIQEVDEVLEQTPQELLEVSYQKLRDTLSQRLLSIIKSCSDQFFEQLVLDLLVAMGYGGSRSDAAEHVGRSGDDGIDGIIKEDMLGLDSIYIQAKKWENSVGRPITQAFAGSLEGQRARKGILITTSYFTEDAKKYVERIEKRIVLIDGKQLTQLMIDYGVGVGETQTFIVKDIDEDYFNQDI